MGLLDAVKNLFAKPASEQFETPVTTALAESEPIKVVELDATELMTERRNGNPHCCWTVGSLLSGSRYAFRAACTYR
jgi:hypothetical protein